MGQSTCFKPGLNRDQAVTIKLSVSAACRRMTTDQILDLADHLHDIIRQRTVRTAALSAAAATGLRGQREDEGVRP